MIRLGTGAAAAACAAFLLAVPSPAAPRVLPSPQVVTGDLTAWREVNTAFQTLSAATYRSRSTDGTLTEFAPPDSWRTVDQRPWGSHEEISVGGATRDRDHPRTGSPGAWQCNPPGSPQQTAIAVQASLSYASVRASREADTRIGGTAVRMYTLVYVLVLNPSGVRVAEQNTVYVDARTALPRRVVAPAWVGAPADQPIATDFYDYGAPIAITLPACGAP